MEMALRKNPLWALAGLALVACAIAILGVAPEEQARHSMIVQAADLEQAAEAVHAAGGTITHELGIINAVAARLTPQQVANLDRRDDVLRIYGDTAVVWFTLRLVGIRQGQQAEVTFRYTDVWVLNNGDWRCVSTQSTKVDLK